ncbi:MAG TPA: hypothetical protein VL400_15035, partial [Polyangiaceae bacterium]|nr:hypothetical protein [Polyangiaceae bacterium]
SPSPIPLETFALLVAAIEVGDAEAALAAHKTSIGAVAASERAWAERAERDPDVRARLETALGAARAARADELARRLSALAEEPIDLETEGA